MSTVGSATTASSIQTDYLNLLAVQLQNQDPMNPLDNNQMATQLAQLSQLQQMENLNSSFARILLTEQMDQAAALVGRYVAFVPDGQSQQVAGKVDSVQVVNGQVQLMVGQYAVPPEAVLGIQ